MGKVKEKLEILNDLPEERLKELIKKAKDYENELRREGYWTGILHFILFSGFIYFLISLMEV